MTIDNLAFAIQKDFDDVHAEMTEMKVEMTEMKAEMAEMKVEMTEMKATMATKDELRSMEGKILMAIEGLRQIVERNDVRLSAYMARTNEDISKLQGSDRDFDVRLRMIEKRG